MKYTLALIAGLALFISCKTKQESSKIAESYGLIYSSFVFSRDAQQKFIDKITESINSIKYDKSATVDTKELATLLDSAKAANRSRISLINIAEEIDGNIKYKEKVLKYVNLLSSLYDNEFRECINIFDSLSIDRYERSSKLLLARLLELKEAGETCTNAGREIRSKYNIEIIDKPSITE